MVKTKNIDMLEGDLWKNIFLFSMPLVFSNVLQVLFNISDLAVIGRFSGADSLGAVGSTSTLIAFYTGFLIGLGGAVNVLVARYLGAKDEKRVRATVHTSLFVSVLFGLLLTVLAFSLARPILTLLGTKEELIEKSIAYLRIIALGMPALAVYNYGNGVYSAEGDSKTPLVILSSSGVLNIGLNLFFVIVCGLDVVGVALATILSQYGSAVVLLILLFRKSGPISLCATEFKWDGARAKEVLRLGIPSGLQNSIFAIANLFIQSGVNRLDVVTVEGNSAAMNFDILVWEIMAAFYAGGASFIGQNYGAKNGERVKKSALIEILYAFLSSALIGGLLIAFGRDALLIFTKDQAVIEAGYERLFIMGFSYFMSAFMDGAIAASRGLGKTFWPSVGTILGSCVFRIAWVYTIFSHFGTLQSLCLLYIFSWGLSAVFQIAYFSHCFRKIFPKKS